MELAEGILESNKARIHYWTGGEPDAPLVVFTHGATVDHNMWEATLPLVGERFRILAWDLRGHGQSRPSTFRVLPAVYDLIDILDKLNVKKAIFVGHSIGGNIHQELAFYYPERVQAMVFLDCTWNFQRLTPAEIFSLRIARPIFKLYPYQWLINQSLALTASSKSSQELLRPAMKSLTKTEFINTIMAGTDCLHYEPNFKINEPLLLMVGEDDRTGNIRKVMPVWAKHEPDSQFVVIPNAKHAANLDNPDFFHNTLLEFLGRHGQ